MSITTARKEAICIHCKKIIKIGERHISNNFKRNGKYISEKLHFDCEDEYNKIKNDERYIIFSKCIDNNPQFYQKINPLE